MNFGVWDWVIVVGFVGTTTVVGLLTKKFVSNYDSFLIAGRKLKLYLAMATMGATELGLVTLMYYSEEGFKSGFSAFIFGALALPGFIFVGATGFIVKGLRRMRCHTITEFFGMRYGHKTQILAATITIGAGLLNMGVFLILGAKFILYMVGIPEAYLVYVMLGLLLLVLSYTVLGGMISVVATDYLQFVLLFAGVLLTTLFAVKSVGYANVIDVVQEHYGRGGFNPIANTNMGPWFVIWLLCGLPFAGGMWPTGVSRALSTTDGKTTQRMYGLIGLSFLGRAMLPVFWGICAFTFFKLNPSILLPMKEGVVDTAAAMPVFLSHILPAGIAGLLTTAALAAMMSTFDSYLLTWSSIIVNDVVVPLSKEKLSDQRKILLTRIVVVLCGIYVFVWGIVYKPPQTYLRFIAITGTMYASSVLICIAMGLYWKRANTAGAVGSMVVAGGIALASILLPMLVPDTDQLPSWIEWITVYHKAGIAAFVASIFCMVIVSLITARTNPPNTVSYSEDEDGRAIDG